MNAVYYFDISGYEDIPAENPILLDLNTILDLRNSMSEESRLGIHLDDEGKYYLQIRKFQIELLEIYKEITYPVGGSVVNFGDLISYMINETQKKLNPRLVYFKYLLNHNIQWKTESLH